MNCFGPTGDPFIDNKDSRAFFNFCAVAAKLINGLSTFALSAFTCLSSFFISLSFFFLFFGFLFGLEQHKPMFFLSDFSAGVSDIPVREE